jgi:hypothetical protein
MSTGFDTFTFDSTAFDQGPGAAPPSPPATPYDLAGAIAARFAANPTMTGGFSKIYESEAGDRPVLPYLLYKILRGTDLLTTDIHYIYDQRVTFKAHATSQPAANLLREAVAAAFGTGSYDFQTGFSIPFFQKDRAESKHPQRGVNNELVFWASIDYSARTHRS